MAKSKVFAVIGLGAFGEKLCRVLVEKGGQVIAIDRDPETVERIKNAVAAAVHVNATDEAALMKAPLDEVDVAVVAIGDDIEASILTTALLKKRNIPYILARAVSDLHQTVLRQVGANEVVNLEIDEGTRIGQRLISPEVFDTIPLSKAVSFAEIQLPGLFRGQTLAKIGLPQKFKLTVAAVRRTLQSIDDVGNPELQEELIMPVADTVLKENDVLLVVGKNEDIEALAALE
ncbi:MAG: TrkA family potassium uptake protein [Spirochaetales bacterium]|nr:TrkA family potassium uptake protein [Spirochaetales bacterium]